MSRTNHHRGQRDNKCGFDFGSKYKVNKYYGGGSGRIPKDAAHRQMRNEGKLEGQDASVALREGDFLYRAEDIDGIDGDGICGRCLGDTWLGDCYTCDNEIMELGDNILYEFPIDYEKLAR